MAKTGLTGANVTIIHSLDDVLAKWNKQMQTKGNITSVLHDDDEARELIEQLAGTYSAQLDDDELKRDGHAAVCIDGRRCVKLADGSTAVPIRQKMAGGNLLTLWVGLELAQINTTTALGDGSARQRMQKVADMLTENGFKVAGHNSTKATSDNNECGAAMKLVEAIQELQAQADAMNHVVESLVGTNTIPAHELADQADSLSQALQADDWSGTKLTDVIHQKSGDANIETLESGDDDTHNHHEEAVVFDFRSNTTLDRDSGVTDLNHQVFWVDMDAIERLAKTFSANDQEKARLYEAMTAFQVAVYDALCDGSHPIGIVH